MWTPGGGVITHTETEGERKNVQRYLCISVHGETETVTIQDTDGLVEPITTFLTLVCGEKNSASAAVTHKHQNEYFQKKIVQYVIISYIMMNVRLCVFFLYSKKLHFNLIKVIHFIMTITRTYHHSLTFSNSALGKEKNTLMWRTGRNKVCKIARTEERGGK